VLKLNIFGRRRPETTLEEHRRHIRFVHGEEVRRYIEEDPVNAPKRYVQNAVFDGTFRRSIGSEDPFRFTRDFVTQVWANDFADLERSRSTNFYQTRLRDDEDKFVDQESVVFLPCHERLITASDMTRLPSWKLFVLIQRKAGVDADDFAAAWVGLAETTESGALAHVQNDVLPVGGTKAMPADAIDEFWFADEPEARSSASRWAQKVNSSLVEPGLAVEGSIVVLLAREDVIYPGDGLTRR